MIAELCKLFGVNEGEEFRIEDDRNIFIINWNRLFKKNARGEFQRTQLSLDYVAGKIITKLPKRKKFTEDELCVLRNIDPKYKWMANDERYGLSVFENKPKRDKDGTWKTSGSDWLYLGLFKHLFKCIDVNDIEPLYINDYCERS